MKNFHTESKRQIIHIFTRILFTLVLGFFVNNTFSQISGTTPTSRCGEGVVVLHATASSGTIKWYTVPFYGTAVATGNTFTTPVLSVTTTYYVDALDANNCSLNQNNARVPVIATISANSIQASIFYSSTIFCKSVDTPQEVTRTGTAGGTFTSSPSGLSINASTGAIIPGSSTVGTFTVTYTVVAAEGCVENPASTTVTITDAPVPPAISYVGSPFCTTSAQVNVNQTGASGGTYSASPSGLTINSSSGTITPSSSLSGTYTITYFVPGAGGCAPQTATTAVTVLQLPTVSISYSSPFTKNQGSQSVSLTGTGVYTGGTFSVTPAGLTIDTSTGAINPSTSTAGDYTVTYTLPAVSPCNSVSATANVTVFTLPTAAISGSTNVCKNADQPDITFTGANGIAPYTFTYKVNDGFEQTITTSGGNSVTLPQSTVTSGTFAYTLVKVTDSHGSTQAQNGTATITVNIPPVALFSYPASPFCSNGEDPLPTFIDNGVAGTFTASPAGLVFVSNTTGQIDLSASTPGSYTVTNTIAPANGCSEVIATANVNIVKLPSVSFSYGGTPYCQNAGNALPVMETGASKGLFTSTPAGLVFVSATTGEVNLAASTPGTYTVTNTLAGANGCGEVTANSSITVDAAVTVGTPDFIIGPTSSRCQGAGVSDYSATAVNSTSIIYTLDATTLAHAGNSINASTGVVTFAGDWYGNTTITATATAYCGNTTTATHVVTTSPSVTVEIPVFSLGSNTTRCQGAGKVTYAATATNSTSISYSLDAASQAGNNSINSLTGEVTFDANWYGNTIITTSATAFCSNTTTADHTVTINPLPIASAGGSQTICSNGTGTVSGASAENGTISWTHDGSGSLSDGTSLTPTYTAASGDAGKTVTLTMTVLTSYANCSGATATATYTINVNPLPAAPTAGNVTVTYDGTSHTGAATAPEGSSVVWYDAPTGGNITVAPMGTNVGTYSAWAESQSDITPTHCTSAARTQVSVTINKKDLSVTATGSTKEYGTALTAGTSATNFTFSGTVGSEAVTSVTLTPDAAGQSATTAAGATYTVTPSLATGTGGFLESNYNVTYTAYTGTVDKKALTVTAIGPAKEYGTALTAETSTTNFTFSGTVGSETVTGVTLTPDAAGQSATTSAGATYTVTPSLATGTGGFLESNYNVTYTAYTGTVNKKALTVTAIGPAKEYGTALTAETSTTNFTFSGTVGSETVTSVTLTPDAAGQSATTAAGTTYTVTPSLAAGTGGFLGSNYNITFTPYTGTVSKKVLTVTADNKSKTYDGSTFTAGGGTFSSTITGFVNSDNAGVVIGSVTYTGDATSATVVGTYNDITPVVSGLNAANYSFSPVNGTLTIYPAAPTGSSSQTLDYGTMVSNLSANGSNIKWYKTSSGGSALDGTTLLVAGSTYYASQTVDGLESINRLPVQVTLNGINASYYYPWNEVELPDNWSSPKSRGVLLTPDFNAGDGNVLGSGQAENVAVLFTGYIDIPYAGNWTFHISSDDGSRLIIDNIEVIYNDGLHSESEGNAISELTSLTQGKHSIRIEYFEHTGSAMLNLMAEHSSFPLAPVPQNWFKLN